MKLMFNKIDGHGKWFCEDVENDDINDYTDIIPIDGFISFDNENNVWIVKSE